MPSKYMVEQAELLHRSKDAELVLDNLRAKYALSSFPSQITRLKQQWFQFGERHDSFDREFRAGLQTLKTQRIAKMYFNKYQGFGNADMKTQLRQKKLAARGELSGSKRTDAVIAALKVLPEYMSLYRLSKTDKDKSCNLAAQRLETTSMQCVQVEDANALVARCTNIITSLAEDPFLITAAVAVLCGRRSCEILRTGVFEPSTRGPHGCLFRRAAKKRGDTRGEHIPILCKFK